MERIKLNELKEWFNRKNRKPLIVFGARQVEKTYLIKKDVSGKRIKRSYLY